MPKFPDPTKDYGGTPVTGAIDLSAQPAAVPGEAVSAPKPDNPPLYVAPTPTASPAPPESTPSPSQSSSNVVGSSPFRNIIPIVIGVGALLLLVVLGFVLVPKFFKKTEAVNLTYWGLWEPESVVKPLIDEYQVANPNVKISYIYQSPREYRERLQNALAQGRGPDIFRIHNSWVPMFKSDLDPVPPEAYSASEFESVFYPTAKSDLRLAGGYVAVPLEFDGLAMYVNDDLLAKSGQTVPQTWEDLRGAAKAMSVCDSQDGTCTAGDRILISGTALGTADNVDHWQDILAVMMLQNNVNLNAPTGVSAEDALSFYTVFTRVDNIWDSTLPSSTLAFAGGKVGIYFAPSWRVFDIQSLNPRLKFSIHPFLSFLQTPPGAKTCNLGQLLGRRSKQKKPPYQTGLEFYQILKFQRIPAKTLSASCSHRESFWRTV